MAWAYDPRPTCLSTRARASQPRPGPATVAFWKDGGFGKSNTDVHISIYRDANRRVSGQSREAAACVKPAHGRVRDKSE
eukprot:717292-Pleurochrysis_carterae.AAC.1